jgi:hemolysin III
MYSAEEEVINSATHFLSAILSVLFTFLIILTVDSKIEKQIPIIIMGLSGAWTFFSSYMYHSSKTELNTIRNRMVDKSSIYTMIAGNGVSICLLSSISFTSIVCCLLLILISSLLTINFCLNVNVTETFTLTSYLLLGWLAVIPASGLFMPSNFTGIPQLICLLSGGIAYSIGVIFYISEKKWYHSIWHGFTILGFGLHFAGCYFCL